MRLALYFYDTDQESGTSDYNIAVAAKDGEPIDSPGDDEFEYLKTLESRIATMAEKILGEYFQGIETDHLLKCLVLKIFPGTSRGEQRFAFRSLCGWIELFDFEQPPLDSESWERISYMVKNSM